MDITHNTAAQRFETLIEGHLAVADYQLRDGVMHMTHTGVPNAIQGRGVAAELVKAALDHAQAHGLKVNPLCSYVRVYMERHPQTQPLWAR